MQGDSVFRRNRVSAAVTKEQGIRCTDRRTVPAAKTEIRIDDHLLLSFGKTNGIHLTATDTGSARSAFIPVCHSSERRVPVIKWLRNLFMNIQDTAAAAAAGTDEFRLLCI